MKRAGDEADERPQVDPDITGFAKGGAGHA
jgi:hypothetical protein